MDDLGAKWSTPFSENLNKNVYVYIYTHLFQMKCVVLYPINKNSANVRPT